MTASVARLYKIFAPNVMAIRDQRHDNMSIQTTSLAGFDVAPLGGASGSRDLMFFIGKWRILSSKAIAIRM